jgi:hypothetical protein
VLGSAWWRTNQGTKMTTKACADDWREIAEHASREAAALRQNARRYEWLRKRMLAADFDYEGAQVLVFEMPDGFEASADCDATIDKAMAAS